MPLNLTSRQYQALRAGTATEGATAPTRTVRWLNLPYPPSTNRLFATVNGRRVKTVEARNYAQEAGMLARMAFPEPLAGRVQVSITAYPPRGIGQDVDNLCKATLDALTGVCWGDDSQVWRLTVERAEKRAGGSLVVCIEAYQP